MGFFTKFIEKFKGAVFYINSAGARSRAYNRQIEQQELCSAIIDCNATHISRGQVLHVIKDNEGRIKEIKRKSAYTKLFARPNPMMTRQDFLYAMSWQLQLTNTAIAWVKWDEAMKPIEVWPIVYLDFEICEIKSGGYAIKLSDIEGGRYTVKLEDLIVLRRKYDGRGYAGQSNDPVMNSLRMVDAIDEGIVEALEVSNRIQGFVKHKNPMMAAKDLNSNGLNFTERLKAAAQKGGVVALDGSEEYVPFEVNRWAATASQAKQITDRVFTYWRTPEEVVKNTASEQVMQNFYDSVVEPTWDEMAEAFTRAVFTDRERDFGNCMTIYSGAATGASWQTKLNIITNTKEIGMLSTNEQRELLGYGPTEDGDERFVSLNYIKSTDMSKYQTGQEPTGGKEDE